MRMWSSIPVMKSSLEFTPIDYKALRKFTSDARVVCLSLMFRPHFRTLLARNIPDRNIIRFSNEDQDAAETAEDLQFVLDIIYTLVVPPTSYERFKNAIRFAQEYKIETVLVLIRQAITYRVQFIGDQHQFDHFRFAIHLGDGPLAAATYKVPAMAETWEAISDRGEGAELDQYGEPWVIEGQSVFEFGAAEFSVSCEIPPMAVWLFLRARCLTGGPGRGICKNEEQFRIQLRRLMTLYCVYSFRIRRAVLTSSQSR